MILEIIKLQNTTGQLDANPGPVKIQNAELKDIHTEDGVALVRASTEAIRRDAYLFILRTARVALITTIRPSVITRIPNMEVTHQTAHQGL